MTVSKFIRPLILVLCLLAIVPQLVGAQSDEGSVFEPAIAYLDTNGNLMMTSWEAEDSLLIAENTNPSQLFPQFQYSQFAFSPDGAMLAFRDGATRNLLIRRSGDDAASTLVEGNTSQFAFDATGTLIYYVGFETTPTDSEFYVDYTIYQISVEGGDSTPLGTYTYEVGCGGGTNDPAEMVYWVANNASFLSNTQFFGRFDGGFLYTMRCDGIGVGIVSDGGDNRVFDDELRRVSLSPDGTKLAGIRPEKIFVYDLLDESVLFEIEAFADQLSWLDDDTVVFSRVVNCAPIMVSTEQAEDLELGQMAFESRFCELSLNTLDISTDGVVETEIFNGSGYGIGGIEAAGENALLFTIIDSQYLMTDGDDSTSIYYLEIGGDGVELVASGISAVANGGAFIVP